MIFLGEHGEKRITVSDALNTLLLRDADGVCCFAPALANDFIAPENNILFSSLHGQSMISFFHEASKFIADL